MRLVICKTCRQVKPLHARGNCGACNMNVRRGAGYKPVRDSLMGDGVAFGKPFTVDGEEMIKVRFRSCVVDWKQSELIYL